MEQNDKPLIWLKGELKTPPFSRSARLEAGFLLRLLQKGEMLGLPQSRPMPDIGGNCHELRIRDQDQNWRVIYCIGDDAIVILDIFSKKTQTTPKAVIDTCKKRLRQYNQDKRRSTESWNKKLVCNWKMLVGLLARHQIFWS